MSSEIIIQKYEPAALEEVVELATCAFYDTELYAFVALDGADRRKFLSAIFRYRICLGASYGQTDLALEKGRIVGAAVWTPPTTYLTAYQHARTALETLGTMAQAVEEFSPLIRERWLGFFALFASARDSIIEQPYWSLTPIAVIPDRQGQKVASKLLRNKFAEMDTQGLPCFLGSQDSYSRDIYLHYGFSIVRHDKVLDSDIVSYSMVRQPGVV
jgi:GNAT superfamily N-acetyltransferase